jgi:retron-type reverse transcriptase
MSKKTFVDIKEIASYNSLFNAYRKCCRGNKSGRKDVIQFGEDLPNNLRKLSAELISGTWMPDTGRSFYLFTEGKWRLIHTVKIEDRIVHQALVYHFALHRRFVKRTFGSIKGRGTLKANKQVRQDLHRSKFQYVIKLDVKKYYPSINKTKLMELVRGKYKGEAALILFEKVLRSYQPESDTGISIGALTSQNNGNFYLTPLDRFILQILGVTFFSRYVDDMVLLCEDKTQAAEWIPQIKEFAYDLLGLVFGRVEVFPIIARRIDFCSYAVNEDNVRLRVATMRRFTRKLRELQKKPCNPVYERSCVCSYLGMLKYCDSNNILKQLKNEYSDVFERIDRYSKRNRSKENDVASSQSRGERVQKVLQSPHSRAGKNRRGQRATRYRGNPMC